MEFPIDCSPGPFSFFFSSIYGYRFQSGIDHHRGFVADIKRAWFFPFPIPGFLFDFMLVDQPENKTYFCIYP